jgi:hypothetical protein
MQRELFFILMDDRYLPNGKTTAKRKNQGMRFQFYSVTSDQLEELAKDIKVLTYDVQDFYIRH